MGLELRSNCLLSSWSSALGPPPPNGRQGDTQNQPTVDAAGAIWRGRRELGASGSCRGANRGLGPFTPLPLPDDARTRTLRQNAASFTFHRVGAQDVIPPIAADSSIRASAPVLTGWPRVSSWLSWRRRSNSGTSTRGSRSGVAPSTSTRRGVVAQSQSRRCHRPG